MNVCISFKKTNLFDLDINTSVLLKVERSWLKWYSLHHIFLMFKNRKPWACWVSQIYYLSFLSDETKNLERRLAETNEKGL